MSLGVQQNLGDVCTVYLREDLGTGVNVFNAAPPVTTDAQMSLFSSVRGSARANLMFLDRLGLWQKRARNGSGFFGWVRIDPLLVDNTSAAIKRFATTSPIINSYAQSGFNPSDPSSQRLFAFNGVNDDTWTEYQYVTDPTSPIPGDPPFPNCGPAAPSAASGIVFGDPGVYKWDGGLAGTWVFFPGWKNGDPSNVLGTAITLGGAVTDDVPFVNSNVTTLINLDTGFATAIEGFPCRFSTTPANKFQSGPLFDQLAVNFNSIQFLPDPDSTAAQPKGQMFVSAHDEGEVEHYAIWREWNPENVPSTSFPRTHLFARVITRFDVVITADSSSFPGASSNILPGTPASPTFDGNHLIVNPLNGRPTIMSSVNLPDLTPYNEDPFITAILEATPIAVFDQYSNPRARQQVTTNRVVVVGADALGDLGEKIEGRDVEWELERISTKAEDLDTTLVPLGGDVFLANSPVDLNNNFPFEVRKGVDVMPGDGSANGYTFVAPNKITFGSAEPTPGVGLYFCDYGHPAAPVASPTFGTLLSNFGVTDSRGEVVTRVQYPDDDSLAGFSDQITIKDPT